MSEALIRHDETESVKSLLMCNSCSFKGAAMSVLEKETIVKKQGMSPLYTVESEENLSAESAAEFPRSEDGLRVSEEEYWETYYNHPDFQYEWNNGILEEKPMADYLSSKVYRWFLALLEEYLKMFPIAKIICLDIGFRLALPTKTSIRKPDLALLLNANTIDIEDDESTYRGIFDLCIEFLSDSKPSEVRRDTVVKKMEYAQGGVKEYFILDRKSKETAFYRLDQPGNYLPIPQPEGILRSEALPGFQFRVEDLYRQPDLRDTISDSVYTDFVLRDYQLERQRAEAAEQRIEELVAKLRTLGVEP
ncbi:MAG: Uma2 family endonuclease [bacterium]|nr:Uma2 family endonuclease [bacterium]